MFPLSIPEETSSVESFPCALDLRVTRRMVCVLGWMLVLGSTAGGVQLLGETPVSESRQGPPTSSPSLESYGKVPLSFEPNRGQTDGRVQFLSRGPGYGIFLTPGEAVLSFQGKDKAAGQSVLQMKLVGANAAAEARAEEKLPGTANYMRGTDRSKWTTGVPTYEKVRYAGVYPGVDLVFYGNQRQLEYDFVVGPGRDAGRIALEFKGATPTVDSDGDLVLGADGEAKLHKPVVYQMVGGERVAVAGAYEVHGQRVGFKLGRYDHSRELVIDPVVTYLTYLGGAGNDYIDAIAIDASGAAYVTGSTSSTDFPLKNAYESSFPSNGGSGTASIFVTKLNQSGTSLVYSTYLASTTGGSAGYGIAVDSSGSAFVAGETYGDGFPVTSGAFQTICGGQHDAQGNRVSGCSNNLNGSETGVLAKLSADGSSLVYATYLSGNNTTSIKAVAVNSAGEAYVTGQTTSSCGPGPYSPSTTESFECFPTTSGSPQSATSIPATGNGFYYAFFTKFDAAGANLIYSGILGPDPTGPGGFTIGSGVAVDANGLGYITGSAGGNTFYTTGGSLQSQGAVNGNAAFVAKFDPAAQQLIYSTYLGGQNAPTDAGSGIGADANGNAYVTGTTQDCDFPTTSGAFEAEARYAPTDTAHVGQCNTGFVAKLNSSGSALVWATYLGDAPLATDNTVYMNALALASDNSVYVAGQVQGSGYPMVNPVLPQTNFNSVAVVTHLSADGSTALFSSTLGGFTQTLSFPSTVANGVALDPTGAVYVAGYTDEQYLPTTNNVVQPAFAGPVGRGNGTDGFVTKIGPSTPPSPSNGLTNNLLANPGAELGSIADWTAGGSGTPTVDTGTFDAGINPHTGSYDFFGGANSGTNSLSQTVSILQQGITAAQVDGGTLFAKVSFWEQGLNQGSPSDEGSVTLSFLDANNGSISTVSTSAVDSHDGTWANGTGIYAIPVGTRSITYVMNFVKNQLTDNDAFIDDNSLSIVTNTGLTIFPGTLHFGNVPVGSTSAAQTVSVTNTQTTTINIAQVASELGANPSDFIQTNTCPAALTAGASCQITVTFVPGGVGPKSAGIDLPDDSSPDDQFVRVDGTGTGGILQVNPGNLKAVAGNGTIGYTGDGGPATAAELRQPNGVAFDPAGNLYIADDVANVVRKVDTSGNITTFAGTGPGGFAGDGGLATAAELSIPFSVASDAAGNIYIQDTGNYVIRKVAASTGIITTFAGTPGTPGHSGDGGPASQAKFNNNQGARFDTAGNFYVPTCRGASIRKIDLAGNISTVAGNFTEGYSGDGGQATAAQLQCPSGVALDVAGNLYIADASNNVIRKVNTQGIISTIAGSTAGTAGASGDGGAATAALLSVPNDVALDAAGNLYIADSANNRVRKIDTNGIITTAAGGLNNAGSAAVNTPLGLTTDSAGHVYFSDSGNGKVQEIFPQGTQPFPATQVGSTSAPQSLTISNIGNVDVTLAANGAFTTSGNAGDFALTPGGCGAGTVLAANGGACAVSITFTPTAVGQRTLTVTIADDALNSPQSFSIGGTGTPATVGQTPTITWATPAAITTATPLSATQLDAVATDVTGAIVPGTYVYSPAAGTLLAAGTQTLSVVFTPNDTAAFTTATKTVSIVVTQSAGGGAATTTTLAVSSGGESVATVAAGSVVKLTATVSANQNSISPGQVAFCDATAAACTDNHLLATAQLIGGDTTSTATYRFVPGIGTHSYKAVFLGTTTGTTSVVGSASAAAVLTVTGTYPTTTTIAQSGDAGSYSLTATTVGIGSQTLAPTGTVSFLDSSNANAVLGTGVLGAGTAGLSFGAATSASNFDAPQTRSVTADFNGDGILDLATANTTAGTPTIYANTVTISLGKGDGTFTTLDTRPATGNRPQSLVAGDFNGDGKADLAVTNIGDGTVSILLGNGDGTFTAGATVAVSGNAYALATADFNGDGTLDIAVSDLNGITVLLGNGDGTFAAHQIGLVAGTTEAFGPIVTADFNDDGKADLIVEGYSPTGQLVVLLGNGDGTFATAPAIAMAGQGSNQNNLVAGDFNGDGKVDFAATNSSQNTVLIMIGNGDGTFVTTPAASGTDYYPVDVVAGDFDGDGKLDLGLAYGSFRQRVLLGNGDGTFTTPSIATGVFAFIGVAVGDFNGDGVPDLAGTDGSTNLEIALTQRTQTAVVAATPVVVGAGTHQVVASYPGDVNYSGSVSSATSLTGAGAGTPVTPTLTWAMPAPITTATPLSAVQLDAVATDINGIALPGTFVYTPGAGSLLTAGTQTLSVVFSPTDAVNYTTATATTTIVVTQAVSTGTTTTLAVSSGGAAVTTVAAGNAVTLTATVVAGTLPVNPGQVAFCDAVAASCTATRSLVTVQVTSAGTATFKFVPAIGAHRYKAAFLGTNGAAASASAAAALAVTGKYATATTITQSGAAGNYTLTGTVVGTGNVVAGPTGTVIFQDTADGTSLGTAVVGASTLNLGFTQATSATTINYPSPRSAVGDFNGDGIADVAFANNAPYPTDTTNANTVTIALGKGDGTFTTVAAHPATGTSPNAIVVGDFNGDGRLDLATADSGSNTVTVLLGNGDGTFTAAASVEAGTNPAGLVAGDFNGDGTEDLAVSTINNAVIILLGNGDGTFTASTLSLNGYLVSMAAGDFNGDGKIDIAVQNVYPTSELEILLGNGDGTFTVGTPVAEGSGSNLNEVAAGDINGDQSTDLVVSNQQDNTVTVLLSNGDGTFRQIPVASATGAGPEDVQVADFNADGLADIAVATEAGVQVLPGNGDGTFTTPAVSTGSSLYGDIAVGDFNGDGIPDVVSSDATTNVLVVLTQITQTTVATAIGVSPLGAGTHQVVASYPGDVSYGASFSAATGLIGITIAPVITWAPAVATIPYGTALGAQQLNATAATAAGVAIPGTFVYTPAAGTVLTAGTQTLSVAFTPTSADYTAATGSATIVVTPTTSVITWATPAMIPYGTALGAQQLNAAAATAAGVAIPGMFVYTPVAGTVLAPGTQTLSVVFTPTDAVDFTTATASVPIVVGGLALSSFAPVGAVVGSADTTITLTGTGFVTTSEVMVNGAAVATVYVNPLTLTAVVPAALLRTAGALTVSVLDPSLDMATPVQTFNVVPATGDATLSGPTTTDPGTQPSVTLSITNPYPLALTAEFNLTFASIGTTPVDDPSIQFSSGGRTFRYAVDANSTSVPPVQLQAGTDAGTITITAKLMAEGVDVTPAGLAPLVIVVPPVVPLISGTTITRSGNTLTVVVHGFSNTREVSQAVFDFTAATGDALATTSLTIPATTIFGDWYSDPTSGTYGSTFTYTQIFNTSSDASTIGSVKVTLTNSVGASLASTSP